MKDDSSKENAKPEKAESPADSSADSSEPQGNADSAAHPEAAKGEISPSEADAVAGEGSYSLGAHQPQEQVIEQAVVEEERWYHKVFAFLSTTAHSIVGFCLFAIAGFFFYQVLLFDLPEYDNEWFSFASSFHHFMLQIPIGVLVYLLFVEFCRRFQWFQPRKRKLPRVPALIVLAFSACIAAGLNYFQGTSGDYMGDSFHTRYLLADLLFAALSGLALAFGAMIVYSKNEFTKLGYLLILLATVGIGFFSGHMGGALRHGEKLYLSKAPQSVRPVLERAFGIPVNDEEEASSEEGSAEEESSQEAEQDSVKPVQVGVNGESEDGFDWLLGQGGSQERVGFTESADASRESNSEIEDNPLMRSIDEAFVLPTIDDTSSPLSSSSTPRLDALLEPENADAGAASTDSADSADSTEDINENSELAEPEELAVEDEAEESSAESAEGEETE